MTDYSVLTQAALKRNKSRILPYWGNYWDTLENLGAAPTNGVISGHVSVDGVAQVGVPVYIYYRSTGKLIQTVITNSNGDYSCNILDTTELSKYFAVCITSSNYNAIIFDKLTAG